MTAAEKYQQLLDEGIPADVLDALVARRPRRVDARVARSALRRDVLDARVEQARLEEHERTVQRLNALGLDGSKLRPPIVPRPSERHLSRALEGAEPERVRVEAGQILGVR